MTDRQEFEKWHTAQCILNNVDQTDGIYCKPTTRRAWAAWKAGAASTSAELTRLRADNERLADMALRVQELQKAYFKTRTKEALIASKQAEKELYDAARAALGQEDLPNGNISPETNPKTPESSRSGTSKEAS